VRKLARKSGEFFLDVKNSQLDRFFRGEMIFLKSGVMTLCMNFHAACRVGISAVSLKAQ
jgi:hypothetical protein